MRHRRAVDGLVASAGTTSDDSRPDSSVVAVLLTGTSTISFANGIFSPSFDVRPARKSSIALNLLSFAAAKSIAMSVPVLTESGFRKTSCRSLRFIAASREASPGETLSPTPPSRPVPIR